MSQLIPRSDGIKYASDSHGQVILYATFCTSSVCKLSRECYSVMLVFPLVPSMRQKYHDESYTECNNVVTKVVTGLHSTLAVSQRMCRGAL